MKITGSQQRRLENTAVVTLMAIFSPCIIGVLIFQFVFLPIADWMLQRIALMGPLGEQERRTIELRKEKQLLREQGPPPSSFWHLFINR